MSTWTLYAGSSPIMDFTATGALAVRYLQGPMGILSRQTSAGAVAWYLADQLGTVRDLIDNTGNILDHVDFSAFGMVLGETNPSVGDRMMGFAGLERDSVTGMNLAVMRVQNAGTGRWTTQDPLSFAAGDANLYRYVGNGATNATDPTGLIDDGKGGHLTGSSMPGPFWSPWRATPPPTPPVYPGSTGDVLRKIYPIAERTWIWDFWPEGCERWAFAFEENLRGFSHPNVKNHGIGWVRSNAYGGGHAVYDFTLDDGIIIRVDHWIYHGGTNYQVIPPPEVEIR